MYPDMHTQTPQRLHQHRWSPVCPWTSTHTLALPELTQCKLRFQGTPYSSLRVGVPREVFPNERRVALTPQNVALLRKKGFAEVLVERDAGTHAQFLNEDYEKAGATLTSRDQLFAKTDIMLKVRPPLRDQEVERIKHGSTLVSFLYPRQNKELVDALAKKNVNTLAMDMIPRISRAQTFDALRSGLPVY